jgi:hypothetical protein
MSCCTRVSGKAGGRRATWCGHAPLCSRRLPRACTAPRHQTMLRGGRKISSARPVTLGRALRAPPETATTSGAQGTGIGCTVLARPSSTLSSRVTSHLSPHACSSERMSVDVFVSACACVLCRFYVYHLHHKILRHLRGCRSRLDGGNVPSKTSMRIVICTLHPPHPTPHTNRQGAAH